jgi:hypothetical protein
MSPTDWHELFYSWNGTIDLAIIVAGILGFVWLINR